MKLLISGISFLLLLSSCVKNNPDPSWIQIDAWTLQDNPNNPLAAGELTHNFNNAWVYIDGNVLGVFELPVKIPILEKGIKEIKLYPAIWNNGISATKKIYPFVEPYTVVEELVQNEVLQITPVTQYYSQVNFEITDFEGFTTGFLDNSSYPATITASNDPTILGTYNGAKFGRVSLNSTNHTWKSVINTEYVLPKSGAEVYMEVDYWSNASISTGVLAYTGSDQTRNPNVRINPQDVGEEEWKKIYIDLKDVVSGSPTADGFYMYFEAVWPDSIPNAEINLDNIKIVY